MILGKFKKCQNFTNYEKSVLETWKFFLRVTFQQHLWIFCKYWNFGIFWDIKSQLWLNDHKYCQFLSVIFVKYDVFHILVDFESDRIHFRESAKSCRNGAHGLNCKILVNFENIFKLKIYIMYIIKIFDENYPTKKKFMSLRQFWNFRTFWNFGNFWIFKWPFRRNRQKYWVFFSWSLVKLMSSIFW